MIKATMPELPEVETICRDLRLLLRGRRICRVEVLEPRLRSPVGPDFALHLEERTVLDVERRGKYIVVWLEGGWAWISHLGMSGKLIYVSEEQPRGRHDHIIVSFEHGGEIRYHDPRRFGLAVAIPASGVGRWLQMRGLVIDPLDRQFCGEYLYSVARASRRRIRDLLMDQRVVAGLGNIYASEILFRAGVRPTKRARRVGRKLAGRIARITPLLLREAIRWRGTSFSDYRDGENRKGGFQNLLHVYNREGRECRVCSHVIKKVRLGSRSTFYCPRCQR
ncbi:MAG: bifunctional DNA-formamidopyrimidine glycosylase/DNA-(apurinic or apyrimidinic site) lyase [Candidatus Binatia bacterium]